jgi:hypothetical protein
MSRLLLAAAAAALLLVAGAFVPVNGKTLVERWNAAPSASAFAGRTLAEAGQAWDRLWDVKPAARSAARPPPSKPGTPARTAKAVPEAGTGPAEHHTEADRSALDRIVAEHASDGPAPGR